MARPLEPLLTFLFLSSLGILGAPWASIPSFLLLLGTKLSKRPVPEDFMGILCPKSLLEEETAFAKT